MGSEQFSQAVRGSSAQPVGVAQTGSLETNDYDIGNSFDVTTYPLSINPSETIQEFIVIQTGDDIEATITTNGGSVFTIPLVGSSAAFNHWNIDSVELQDPNGTGQRSIVAFAADG